MRAAILLLCGCGRLAFDPSERASADATRDGELTDGALPACQPTGPYNNPVRLASVSDDVLDDFAPRRSTDGLTLALEGGPPGGPIAQVDIWIAERPDRASPFPPAVPITAINTTSAERNPSLTGDGLTLFFHRDAGGGNSVLEV